MATFRRLIFAGAGWRAVHRHQLRQTGASVSRKPVPPIPTRKIHQSARRLIPVGWSSLLDYLFLPMINVLLAKIHLSALFPEVPPWVWVVTFVAILTAANLKKR